MTQNLTESIELSALQANLLELESSYQDGRNTLEQEAGLLRKREEEVAVLEEKVRSESRRAEGFEQEIRLSHSALDDLEKTGVELATGLDEMDNRILETIIHKFNCKDTLK